MLIKFWGVHGSLPRPGPTTLKFGGNTACVEVRCDGALIIFDAGTGIRELGEDLEMRAKAHPHNPSTLVAHIFFSHLHWDHVQGFPFFDPIYKKGAKIHLYGGPGLTETTQKLMSIQMCSPNFPVPLEELPSSLGFHEVHEGDRIQLGQAVVRVEKLNHPGGSFGYRLEEHGKSVVYASDTEQLPGVDRGLLELAQDADILIHDSMYHPEQYQGLWDDIPRESWGHSTWEGAVELAQRAKVKRLILFHHGNKDSIVEDIERKARARFPHVTAGYEGLEIQL
jgi:phosphoribosyl 1,2-cyclic phosphodiesterase